MEDALDTGDVSYFVGIGNDGGRAESRHQARGLGDGQFCAFQVDVGVNKSWNDEFSTAIEGMSGTISRSDSDDILSMNGDVGIFLEFAAEYVDEGGMGEEQIDVFLSHGFESVKVSVHGSISINKEGAAYPQCADSRPGRAYPPKADSPAPRRVFSGFRQGRAA